MQFIRVPLTNFTLLIKKVLGAKDNINFTRGLNVKLFLELTEILILIILNNKKTIRRNTNIFFLLSPVVGKHPFNFTIATYQKT